jgi:hypothetical protein
MGHLQRLRREAAPAVLGQPGAPLLRAHPRQDVPDVRLAEELLAEAGLGEAVARRLLGDLAYGSEDLRVTLAEVGILLATEPSERRHGARQHVEIAISSLKRVFGLGETLGETLAATLVGLWQPGSRRRSAPTPLMASTSTGYWVAPKAGSRSCGHENLATLI